MGKTTEQILDYLDRTAQSIAQTFGPSCETLIHDMSKPGHPIIVIYNGHVSGRRTGDTSDIFGGNRYASGDTTHFKPEADMVNTLVIRENGHRIKSTTVNYIGDNFHYALGINFDCTELMSAMNALETLIATDTPLQDAISENNTAPLEQIFSECVMHIGIEPSDMKKSDRLQLLRMLLERRAFTYQKSIMYVAKHLNVSRYTIYKYLHEIDAQFSEASVR